MGNQAKNWTITLNNPDQECLGEVPDMQYMICGIEYGDKKKTKHIQGYIQFTKRKRLNQLKQLWPTAHFQVARGTPSQNYEYCSKDGNFHEHGKIEKHTQGRRKDLEHVKESIDSGGTLKSIRELDYSSYIRYGKAIARDIEDVRPDRSWPTELHILWGDTNTGKSRKCHQTFPEGYWKTRGEWWDGYEGHDVVILDEFYGWLPMSDMLRLCDRYPMQVPVKGGFRKFVARKLYITSNKPWEEWWKQQPERKMDAFRRRITTCTEFKKTALGIVEVNCLV